MTTMGISNFLLFDDKVGTVFVLIDSRQVIDPSRSQLIEMFPLQQTNPRFWFHPKPAMI